MGKIIASVSSTFDGILSGPKGDENNMVSWALPGIQDSAADNMAMFQQADAILMGRTTYEGFAGFWPFQEGDFADAMNKTKKYIASHKGELKGVSWGDYADSIELLDGDVEKQVAELKKKIKGDIIIPASSKLVQSLINAGLLDEFHTILHPVILGSGVRYLEGIDGRHDMKLIDSKVYSTSGSILLKYEVIK